MGIEQAQTEIETDEREAPATETAVSETPDAGELSLDEAMSKRFDEIADNSKEDEIASENDADKTSSPESEEGSNQEAATPAIDAPQSWSKEMREHWASLSPEAQGYIVEREKQAQSGITRLGQQLKEFEPVANVYEKHKSVFEHHGMSLDQGLDIMMNWQAYLDRDPVAALKDIARAYNQDLEEIAFSDFDSEDGANPQSGQITALQNEIAVLKQQLATTQAQTQSFTKAIEEQNLAEKQGIVQRFMEENPDAKEIYPLIKHNMNLVRERNPQASDAEILQDAYELSRWQDPATRAKLIAKQSASDDGKLLAEKAKRAGNINVNSNPQLSSVEPDLDSELMAILNR